MRIIAGKYRGKVLAGFRGQEIRPTSDRVKESLFQILTPKLAGARVLDLFCGSGALGLEALSRGAKEAVFNDISPESLALCKRNVASVHETGEFHCKDFSTLLNSVSGKFTIIFVDPPYREDVAAQIMNRIAERNLLEEGGIAVFESEREEAPIEGWRILDFRSYGRTKITMMERIP